MKACPVCKRPNLADGLARCPQCNADLECFDLLDALWEEPTARAPVPPISIAAEERSSETGSRTGELHGSPLPVGPGARKLGWIAGSASVLLLVLVPFMTFTGSRYLGERIDQLEHRLASADKRIEPFPAEWPRLYAAVQTLNTRMEGMAQQLAGLTTQPAEANTEARRTSSQLEEELVGMGARMSRCEAQLASSSGQRQDTDPNKPKAMMAELTASGSPDMQHGGPAPRSPGRSSSGGPGVPATPARAPAFTEYRAAPTDTLWQIARRFYGKGIYYPVLLEDHPGLAIHGFLDGRTIRIALQRQHGQDTYRRLVFTEGGRKLFRYRVQSGDSWRSLAQAFYGKGSRARELAELNGAPHPETGRRVLVPLD